MKDKSEKANILRSPAAIKKNYKPYIALIKNYSDLKEKATSLSAQILRYFKCTFLLKLNKRFERSSCSSLEQKG